MAARAEHAVEEGRRRLMGGGRTRGGGGKYYISSISHLTQLHFFKKNPFFLHLFIISPNSKACFKMMDGSLQSQDVDTAEGGWVGDLKC